MSRRSLIVVALLALACRLPASGAAPTEPAVVELPPMFVSEQTGTRPWRYVSTPDLEILARCDDDIIEALVERTSHLNAVIALVLPEELTLKTTAPRAFVLVDKKSAPGLSREFLARFGITEEDRQMAATSKDEKAAAAQAVRTRLGRDQRYLGPGARYSVLANLMLHDVDSTAVFALADSFGSDLRGLTFTPEHMRHLLGNRTPPLPAWFIAGWVRYYERSRIMGPAIKSDSLQWISDRETQALRTDPDAPRRVMPLRDFFAVPTPPVEPTAREHWSSQADLLVRWILSAPERRAALGGFVATFAREGESEALFRRCFGVGYADARDQLSDFLADAVADGFAVTLPRLPRPPRVHPRNATPAEIGRIKGDWERLVASYVKRVQPTFAAQYLGIARETVAKARENAPSDGGVLAVAGLLEVDQGNFTDARPLLEAAVARQRCRPRVYAELAGLRLEDLAKPDDNAAYMLSPAQAGFILDTLAPAREQLPPIAKTFAVSAAVWARSDVTLGPAELAQLSEGVERFPHDLQLLYFVAMAEARHRSADTGIALARRGLALATAPAVKKRFTNLLDVLVRAKAAAGQPRTSSAKSN